MHFWRLRILKNGFSPERGANFHKIGVFEKSFKKTTFGIHFGRPRPSKIDEKWCSKPVTLLTSKKKPQKTDFGIRFGLPKPPKINPKLKKIASEALSKTSRKKQAPDLTDQTRDPPGRQAFEDPAGPSNHHSND